MLLRRNQDALLMVGKKGNAANSIKLFVLNNTTMNKTITTPYLFLKYIFLKTNKVL